MSSRTRAVSAACAVAAGTLGLVAPAWAQTGGLESPPLWLLIASLAQIVGAAALVVFLITRGRPRRCPRCGQRLGRGSAACPRCEARPADGGRPAKTGA